MQDQQYYLFLSLYDEAQGKRTFGSLLSSMGLYYQFKKALKASRELAGVSCVFFFSPSLFHPLNPILSEDLIKTHIVFPQRH
jgi:hypothetical protein